MNVFLLLAIFLANAIALTLVYQFIKKLEKRDIVIFMAVSVTFIYIGVSIIYWISGLGIDARINEAAKNFITFLFVPINIIILVPFVASKYAKYKNNKVTKRDFVATLIRVIIIALLILIIECIYFKHMKSNIKALNNNIEQTMQSDKKVITNSIESNKTNTTINETINTMVNSESVNIISNSVTNQTKENETSIINQLTNKNQY